MPKQKKSKPKPAKTEKKELSAEELDSVAGGVVLTMGAPLVDKTLATASKPIAAPVINPFPSLSDKDLSA